MRTKKSVQQFQEKILQWYAQHGRKNLPWQQGATPYHVWISEIMLQQTQVATVIPYFNRFLEHFPDIHALAKAEIDDVLQLWAGLGYYARARNIHRCAQIIVNEYHGQFPSSNAELQKLPGIGRSTAGAILSLGMDISASILDGNVKRVLTRCYTIKGWPGESNIQRQLWSLIDEHTPEKNTHQFNQAMMDIGALICTPKHPECEQCPLQKNCLAHQRHTELDYPTKKATAKVPLKNTIMLIMQDRSGKILMVKRPPIGIWGGLWSFPECESAKEISAFCETQFHCVIKAIQALPAMHHTFSHFKLCITPHLITVQNKKKRVMDPGNTNWYDSSRCLTLAIPKPIKDLIKMIGGYQ